MRIIVIYKIADKNKRRWRKVSKICGNFGVRVTNTVFLCDINYQQYLKLKNDLLNATCNEDCVQIMKVDKVEYIRLEGNNTSGLLFI